MYRDQELKVTVSAKEGVVTMKLVGEAHLDWDGADRYIHQVMDHHPRGIIIDASQLSFISSVGMNVLLQLRRAMMAANGSLRIAGLQPLVKGALHHAGLLPLFDVHPDMASALAAKPKDPPKP